MEYNFCDSCAFLIATFKSIDFIALYYMHGFSNKLSKKSLTKKNSLVKLIQVIKGQKKLWGWGLALYETMMSD